MKKIVLFVLFSILTIEVHSQGFLLLNHFNGYVFKDEIVLNWELKQGSTCNGIKILKGQDTTDLNQIGEILGICGSNTEPVKYKFVDKNPIPNLNNFYCLELGINGKSNFVVIEYFQLRKNIALFPNPNAEILNVYFLNERNESIEARISNPLGKMILEKKVPNGNNFSWDISQIPNGQYFIEISIKGNKKISDSFLKY